MSQGVGSSNAVLGWADTFGGKGYAPVDYKGSTSYVQGGDSINPAIFGLQTILTLIASADQKAKFQAIPLPVQNGISPWQLMYVSTTTGTVGGQSQTAGTEAAAGTNLSGFTVRLSAIGR